MNALRGWGFCAIGLALYFSSTSLVGAASAPSRATTGKRVSRLGFSEHGELGSMLARVDIRRGPFLAHCDDTAAAGPGGPPGATMLA